MNRSFAVWLLTPVIMKGLRYINVKVTEMLRFYSSSHVSHVTLLFIKCLSEDNMIIY